MNILRHPILHFTAGGAVLFALFGMVPRERVEQPQSIVVSPGRIEQLAASFAATWQRPPSPDELKGLLDDHVREEVLVREARKLGLDREDPVIRKRLRQKMEFLLPGTAVDRPDDAALEAFLRGHAETFLEEARYSFRHVSFRRDSPAAVQRAAAALAVLNAAGAAADPASLGDPSLLRLEFDDERQSAVAAQFGDDFAAKLATLPVGTWSGPVDSSFGVHLVLVTSRTEARSPRLEEIRDAVARAWTHAQLQEANRRRLDALLAGYEVKIEWPQPKKAEPGR